MASAVLLSSVEMELFSAAYPTLQVASTKESRVLRQNSRELRPKSSNQPRNAPLTCAGLKPFRIFTQMLDFCSQEFEKRWNRPWRWEEGKIARSYFDKDYYVWTVDGSEYEFLADQRYFSVTRSLHWLNHGYDTGYDHKLPNI